jgi:hypothetical protein
MNTQTPDFIDSPPLVRFIKKKITKGRYWQSALERSLRSLNDEYYHVAMPFKLTLPDNFTYDQNRAQPRGLIKEGKQYSSCYSLQFSELPDTVLDAVRTMAHVARLYFQEDVVIRPPYLWRNHHIPESLRFQDIYSDNFHQDLVVDQFNLQLFVLLHDVTLDHGPFIYLTPVDQAKYLNETKSRLDNLIYPGIPFVGKRGDAMLFSTGYTLHRASSPSEGYHRDLMSIAFFQRTLALKVKQLIIYRNALPRKLGI